MKDKSLSVPARKWLAWLVCCVGLAGAAAVVADEVDNGPPAVEDLQAGDLIWPKDPNVVIPYVLPGQTTATDKEAWQRERDEYLAALLASPSLTELDKQRIKMLRGMSYESFLKIYGEDVPPNGVTPAGGVVGVGHVAIVRRIADQSPTIVEALWGIGVREIAYEKWKAERQGQIFWHGRLRDVDPALRADVAERAYREVEKPYDFWNFDLADASGFYCSKLAWLTIRDATGIVVDDKPDPVRMLWFSPKQLLKSPYVEMLQNPGSYGLPRDAE